MCVATGVSTYLDIIDEHVGSPVDCLEVEHQPPVLPCRRDSEGGLVPQGVFGSELAAYAGK